MQLSPLVSIIIPTFNSAKTISTTLESIKNQDYQNIEVIIVDNDSVDNTAEIALESGARVIVFESGRSSARNHGVRESKGDFFLHIDSDMELTSRVVGECVEECRKNIDAIIIPEISIGEGYFSRCRSIQKRIFINQEGFESARFIKRLAFEEINGYDEELELGEDFDLHFRLKKKQLRISRINSLIMHHEGRLTLKKMVAKNRFYARSASLFAIKNVENISEQPFVIQIYIKNWRTLLRNLELLPGILLMLTLEFLLLGRYARHPKKKYN
jgi:glycosyltransferase involved in cell wall biosynthesis